MVSKSSKSKAIREFKSNGNKAMASGAFQKAARQYTKAIDLDPANAILYSNRSAAHFNLRQFAESLEDAESAILCDSMWWKAYKRKGLSLIHMQRYEEAIKALEKGLEIVKKNAEMEKNLEFARACQEQAQNLYILPEPNMMQRLESVPVFIVTDDVGQPFFITYEDGQQVCTFYFDKSDANSTLDWIKSENPDLGDTARVIHITLNQAFNLAQETQKQYYDETTRAAVEEDRLATVQANTSKSGAEVHDVDGSDEDKEGDSGEQSKAELVSASEASTGESEPAKKAAVTNTADSKDDKATDTTEKKKDGNNSDGSIIDDNAPLSFQFRPELRQVQVAVELLNKNPNPPVRPILRDPPSVRKAKAEAAAVAAASGEGMEEDEKEEDSKDKDNEKNVECTTDDTDEELTVDNFNGIPVFQAKGLTLLQNNEQLIPLFFSKWDLEAAWKQLMTGNSGGVPDECEVDVGTLEDVLRRMSESKTKEFDSVFFVPSRESMKAIGAKFPLDDLTSTRPMAKPAVPKAAFSKAKQIAARGGTKEEVRAAIREDLELAAERQRMADIIAQIEQARRLGGVSAAGLMPDGRKRSGRIDRTMRRNAQRMALKQAARNANSQSTRRPPQTLRAEKSEAENKSTVGSPSMMARSENSANSNAVGGEVTNAESAAPEDSRTTDS